jgi:hypothetical protein
VLIGGTMTLAALLVACGLPDFHTPVLDRSLTDDRFAIFIPESGRDWNETRALDCLKSTKPVELRVVRA